MIVNYKYTVNRNLPLKKFSKNCFVCMTKTVLAAPSYILVHLRKCSLRNFMTSILTTTFNNILYLFGLFYDIIKKKKISVMQFIYKIKSINGNNMLRLQHRYNIITGTITRNTLRSSYINVCKEGLK